MTADSAAGLRTTAGSSTAVESRTAQGSKRAKGSRIVTGPGSRQAPQACLCPACRACRWLSALVAGAVALGVLFLMMMLMTIGGVAVWASV